MIEMVNENNKFVPQAPKTYMVCELQDQQVKKSPLSPAARGKIVNRSGSNYVSKRVAVIGPDYGPGIISISGGRDGSFSFPPWYSSDLLPAASRSCAASPCFAQIPSSEYYCVVHELIVGKVAAEAAKVCAEVADREGGIVIVSTEGSGKGRETTVKYYSSKK